MIAEQTPRSARAIRRTCRRGVTLGLALTIVGCSLLHADPSPLQRAIRIDELRIDRGGERVPLPFGRVDQYVDINSAIEIRFDSDELTRALGGDVGSPELMRSLRQIEEPLDALRGTVEMVRPLIDYHGRITRLRARVETASSPSEADAARGELSTVNDKLEALLGEFSAPLERYRQALADSEDPKLRARAERFDLDVESAVQAWPHDTSPFLRLVAEEVTFFDPRIEELSSEVRATLQRVAVMLVAYGFAEKTPTRIPLNHYDTLPPGVPVAYDKINWAADSAEARELYQQVEPLASTLQAVHEDRIELREALEDLLRQNGLDVSRLTTNVRSLAGSIEELRDADWEVALETFGNHVGEALRDETLTTEQRDLLEAIREDADTLRDNARSLIQAVRAFETSLDVPSLDELAKRAEAADNPIDALDALVQGVENVATTLDEWRRTVDGFAGDLRQLIDDGRGLVESLDSLIELLRPLPDQIERTLRNQLRAFSDDKFTQVVTDAIAVADEAARLVQMLDSPDADDRFREIRAFLASDMPIPDDVVFRLGSELRDTVMDLRKIKGRQDGTGAVLEARLFRLKEAPADGGETVDRAMLGEEIERLPQVFVMKRFGWFSAPSVTVAYVSAVDKLEGQDDETTQFVPQSSWLFKYRRWNDDTSRSNASLRSKASWWGIGVHAVPLDLDRDNGQEIGVGVTLSLLDDWIQLGGGVDLSVDEEPYYFIGLRVFQFGKGLGVKDVPRQTEAVTNP